MKTIMTLALLLAMNITFAQTKYMANRVTEYQQIGASNNYTPIKVLSNIFVIWTISDEYVHCDIYDSPWPVKKVIKTKEGKKYLIDLGYGVMTVIVSGNIITYYDGAGTKQVFRVTKM